MISLVEGIAELLEVELSPEAKKRDVQEILVNIIEYYFGKLEETVQGSMVTPFLLKTEHVSHLINRCASNVVALLEVTADHQFVGHESEIDTISYEARMIEDQLDHTKNLLELVKNLLKVSLPTLNLKIPADLTTNDYAVPDYFKSIFPQNFIQLQESFQNIIMCKNEIDEKIAIDLLEFHEQIGVIINKMRMHQQHLLSVLNQHDNLFSKRQKKQFAALLQQFTTKIDFLINFKLISFNLSNKKYHLPEINVRTEEPNNSSSNTNQGNDAGATDDDAMDTSNSTRNDMPPPPPLTEYFSLQNTPYNKPEAEEHNLDIALGEDWTTETRSNVPKLKVGMQLLFVESPMKKHPAKLEGMNGETRQCSIRLLDGKEETMTVSFDQVEF